MTIEELAKINGELVCIGGPFTGDKPEDYEEAIVGLTDDQKHVIYDYDKLAELMAKVHGKEEE